MRDPAPRLRAVRDRNWGTVPLLEPTQPPIILKPSAFRVRLQAGRECGCAKTAAVCQDLLRLEPALWTFTRMDGVEPTNNAVERGFRHLAQWRRHSHGTQSAAGSRCVEQILTVVATCRQ